MDTSHSTLTHRRHKTNSGDTFTFPAMSPDTEPDSELADRLFSNGKFLLHPFPIQPKPLITTTANCMMFSRTTSLDSKDSLVSSRSTSTNSRSSSSSSARTSTSDGSNRTPVRSPVHYGNSYYLPAQRWQFMAPVPVLNRRSYSRRKVEEEERLKQSPEKEKRRKGFCRRFFRWVVSTCKECHAIEPSKKVF